MICKWNVYILAASCMLTLYLPSAASAQTVQKCRSREGVRFQSAPCGVGERTVEVWDATPAPEVAAPRYASAGETRSVRGRARRHGARRSRRTSLAMLSGTVPQGRSCADARAYRDAMERRAGLDRNYDLLSALQRPVFDACR